MSGITLKYDDIASLTGLKQSSLNSVEKLDLSGSKIKYFETGVFSKLKNLKNLNLSDNLLRVIPDNVACDLKNIEFLNVSKNSLMSLEFLKSLKNLKEIVCDQNGLDISQKFLAAYLCPLLQKVDSKTIENQKHLTSEFKEKLDYLYEKLWMEKYPDLDLTSASDDIIKQTEVELVKLAKAEKPSISGVPQLIKEFMIKHSCMRFLQEVTSGNKRLTRSSPKKKVKMSPVKKANLSSPVKSPNKNLVKKRLCSPNSSKQIKINLSVPDYNPTHFIRCHSGDKKALKNGRTLDDPTDEETNVWCCAFEPDPTNNAKSTGVVATCGGCVVCLIDCSTGQVLNRFIKAQEQFYCLAWTTLNIGNSPSNVLAVSGLNGKLKLLHPSQRICYLEYGTGRPNKSVDDFYYSGLLFHPVERTWLFCSSSDSTITLFDIGIPSGSDYSTEIKQLAMFISSPAAKIFSMFLNNSSGLLVGGTSKGVMMWCIGKDGERSSKTISAIKRKEPVKRLSGYSDLVDSLAQIDDDHFACKFLSDDLIYIFDSANPNSGPLFKLQWIKTTLGFIGLHYRNGILSCGTDDGRILLYKVDLLISRDSLIEPSDQPVQPSRILHWPKCRLDLTNDNDSKMVDVLDKPEPLVVNSSTISSDGRTIVALTDCNLVCIWRSANLVN